MSLTGLSVGDALGERFFGREEDMVLRVDGRVVPPPPWRYTDETEMALSVVEVLGLRGTIDQDVLVERLCARFDPSRGYGRGCRELLSVCRSGESWRRAATAQFGGRGSIGNGAAARVAPVGAWFADDLDRVVFEARRSAEVTHVHREGVAGAVAVAVAAAMAWRQSAAGRLDGDGLLRQVTELTPRSSTRERLLEATGLPAERSSVEAARRLGAGHTCSAQDTVPYALWCAARHLGSYEEAFWATVRGLGDRDTTCAIVGGIVALSSRQVPEAWVAAREAPAACLPVVTA